MRALVAGWHVGRDPGEEIVSGLDDNLPPSIASARPELERLLDTARPGLMAVGTLARIESVTPGA